MVGFRLFGPVDMESDAGPVDVGPPQRQSVLAALAVDAGRQVSAETLIDRVWGESSPDGARRALQAHITRIRRLLDHAAAGEAVTVSRRANGYVLEVEPERVDLHRFTRLAEQAREPGLSGPRRLELLRDALALWRGVPLAGLPGDWAARVREGWGRRRLDVAIAWAALELEHGRREIVAHRLRDLRSEHPLSEPLVAALMRALHATGNGAEALACYASFREELIERLGTEPGAELQGVHQALLRDELPSAPAPRGVPEQLPLDVRGFTARAAELARLDAMLTEAARHPTAVIIAAISGTAGVGKTTLAVHWAHRVRAAFPDGRLYLDLRGYDAGPPVAPADALAGLLLSLGVPGQDIPLDSGQRAARWRTEVSGRRLLVVLDNASSAEQVRPLLPGSPSTMVLVTSRDSLPGLVSLYGAHRIELGLLPLPDAVALLGTLIGDRVAADPGEAAVLAEQCAQLPLALRVAAELAATRPAAPLTELTRELADQRGRLDLLEAGGDQRAAVRAVFSWSYQRLSPTARTAFRLLGLSPGADLDAHAAAALTGQAPDQAGRALAALARVHLLQTVTPGRYGMHDLLRAYAAWLSAHHDEEDDRQAALTRLLDHYLTTAAAAMDILYPAERHRRPKTDEPTPYSPRLADAAAARSWLDRHRPALLAAGAHAAGHGLPDHTVRLAATLYVYLDNGGHFTDALTMHTHALRAARLTGDLAGEGGALGHLGVVHWQLGHYERAAEHMRQALVLFGRIGDRSGQARTLGNLGVLYRRMGRLDPAVDHHQRALALFRDLGDRVGEANTLTNLGDIDVQAGRLMPAADRLVRALEIFGELGHIGGEATALNNLADVEVLSNRPERAIELYRQSLARFRQAGERYGEVCALNGLGEAGRLGAAYADAIEWHLAALDLAEEIGERDEQARAQRGLGHARHAAGDPAGARRHWERALAIYTELGTPDADEMRARLERLDAEDDGPG
ncbi:tetratricopeptide repeat protein [Nonomuraea sp. NPDC050643]|uniref:AfsR/SARP family transcriptional regulator n=1 Tax=Nonomuraea sp. NPDC050643 TaxID=3155660 RepID=UPI0033FE4135